MPVQGRFTSKHLGIAAAFPESWQHQKTLDTEESRGDWERDVSVFFRGVNVEEFIAQITLVTIVRDDRAATETDLRDVARTELAGTAAGRRCLSYDRYGTKAVRCTAISTRNSRRYGMIEEYFLAGRRIVFARALVEALPGEIEGDELAAPPPDVEPAPPTTAPTLRGYISPISEMDAREIESVLDSIEAVQDD